MSRIVGKIWWHLPDLARLPAEGGQLEQPIRSGEPVTFGSHSEATIQMAPPTNDAGWIPQWWGQLEWAGGRIHVANTSQTWGFDLIPTSDPSARRIVVPPQVVVSPASYAFDIATSAPHWRHLLHVTTMHVRPSRPILENEQEAPEPGDALPFRLTKTERDVGLAIVAALRTGARRPSYTQIGSLVFLSSSRVREIVREMDRKFADFDLSPSDGDTLDRVSAVVSRHQGLLH